MEKRGRKEGWHPWHVYDDEIRQNGSKSRRGPSVIIGTQVLLFPPFFPVPGLSPSLALSLTAFIESNPVPEKGEKKGEKKKRHSESDE